MQEIVPLGARDPRWVGGFQLLGRLGAGGQGVVYQGRGEDGTLVAVKVLREELVPGRDHRGALAKELEAARRVAPFCTAQVIASDLEAERPYVVSEYVDGPSLDQTVRAEGPRTGNALHRLAVATATALVAIHEAGIVHRDLKPANVLIGPDGPRVIDFGIARIVEAGTTTITGRLIGTPAYMSPEQAAGTSVGPASDVFSWGGVMAYAALGRSPFGSGPAAAVIARITHEEPDLGDLAEPLRALILACLAKDPAARPTAHELLMRLIGASRSAPPLDQVLRTGQEIAGSPAGGPPGHRPPPRDPTLPPRRSAQPVAPPDSGRDTPPTPLPRLPRRAPLEPPAPRETPPAPWEPPSVPPDALSAPRRPASMPGEPRPGEGHQAAPWAALLKVTESLLAAEKAVRSLPRRLVARRSSGDPSGSTGTSGRGMRPWRWLMSAGGVLVLGAAITVVVLVQSVRNGYYVGEEEGQVVLYRGTPEKVLGILDYSRKAPAKDQPNPPIPVADLPQNLQQQVRRTFEVSRPSATVPLLERAVCRYSLANRTGKVAIVRGRGQEACQQVEIDVSDVLLRDLPTSDADAVRSGRFAFVGQEAARAKLHDLEQRRNACQRPSPPISDCPGS